MSENPEIAQTSIYLTPEYRQIVRELQESTGLGRSELFRHALRRMYEGEDRDRQTRLLQIAEELRQLA